MTGLERLDVLREALKAEMPKDFEFNFIHFFMVKDEGCGSSGCALGLAGTLKAFNEQGLHIDEDEQVRFGLLKNFAAAANFFEITFQEVEWLFGSRSYGKASGLVTSEEVAIRIGIFLMQRRAAQRVQAHIEHKALYGE